MSRAQLTSTVEQSSGGAVAPFLAGKNKIINGDFGIWQRGTSFAGGNYTADRFYNNFDGTGSTRTISQQTFAPGTAPVSGYEGTYFYRFNQSVAGTSGTYNNFCVQAIEDVRIFASQTVTLSFWAKSDATRTITPFAIQNFGSGGSSSVVTSGSAITTSTSWARYSQTISIPTISGKTIGTSSSLQIALGAANNTVQIIDLWGIQIEVGSVATPFTTATGTLQGELAACQRYYVRSTGQVNGGALGPIGQAFSTTQAQVIWEYPVSMRTTPSFAFGAAIGNNAVVNSTGSRIALTASSNNGSNSNFLLLSLTVASGLVAGYSTFVCDFNSGAGYLEVSAEL
jgi:hypothetical protein